MSLARRDFLAWAGAGVVATLAGCDADEAGRRRFLKRGDDWGAVRRAFPLSRDHIHLAGLLIASHPSPVADAIERHRRRLDENPPLYLEEHNQSLEDGVRDAAADYLGGAREEYALTDSTTMAIALVYAGIAMRPGQEILTTDQDYYSTHESIGYRATRSGVTVREVALPADPSGDDETELIERIAGQIRPETRVLALTWVHSSTGLKIPVRGIAQRVAALNAGRAEADRALLCLDAVHALGVEDFDVHELGCDFVMAGTHKWLFAPRGTGILWGHPRSQAQLSPIIPTFTRGSGWGGRMTPGGFKAFEHRWAAAEAFRFHHELGRDRVAARIRDLAAQCKAGLAGMPHVRLRTPTDPGLSAGIVCFDVEGLSASTVVERLRDARIIASTTPYTGSHARLTPGLFNTPDEVDRTMAVIRGLG